MLKHGLADFASLEYSLDRDGSFLGKYCKTLIHKQRVFPLGRVVFLAIPDMFFFFTLGNSGTESPKLLCSFLTLANPDKTAPTRDEFGRAPSRLFGLGLSNDMLWFR